MGKAKSRITQIGESSGAFEEMPNQQALSTPVGGRGEASEAVVEELIGHGDEGTYPSSEAIEADGSDYHVSMSSPLLSVVPARGAETGEEAGEATESAFENVAGWDENQLTEAADEESEPTVEAYYADTGSREFLPILGAVLAPAVKTILPVLAGAIIKQGAQQLSPRAQMLLRRLSALGVATQLRKGREAYEAGEAPEVDVADVEAQLAALEVVIGHDDRVRVTNTRVVPWKRICHLRIQSANGGIYLGTGFFIGPRTIATAGHCVYQHGQGGWAREITVTPGRDAASEPFGKFKASAFRSVRGWVMHQSRNHDYGVIILPRSAAVPVEIGAFGFGYFPDTYLLNKKLNTAGYPGDKPAGTMWFNGRHAKAVSQYTITYDIDTAGGQSGSAVWVLDPASGKRVAVGIHTNGSPAGNSATRITAAVFENLKRWRTEGGGEITLRPSIPRVVA